MLAAVRGVFAELLDVSSAAIPSGGLDALDNEDFFALGGDSALAGLAVGALRAKAASHPCGNALALVTVRHLYQHSSACALAAFLEDAHAKVESSRGATVPVSGRTPRIERHEIPRPKQSSWLFASLQLLATLGLLGWDGAVRMGVVLVLLEGPQWCGMDSRMVLRQCAARCFFLP